MWVYLYMYISWNYKVSQWILSGQGGCIYKCKPALIIEDLSGYILVNVGVFIRVHQFEL